jgi:hypothetical protein
MIKGAKSRSPSPSPAAPPAASKPKRKAEDAGLPEKPTSRPSTPTQTPAEASTSAPAKKPRVEGPAPSSPTQPTSSAVSQTNTVAGKDSFTTGTQGKSPAKPAAETPVEASASNTVKPITQKEIDALPNQALKDFAELGYGNAAQLLAKSDVAVKRLNETSTAGVQVGEGAIHGRSHTSRSTSSGKVVVYMDPTLKTKSPEAAAGTFMFEMNNAHRRPKFEALDDDVRTKKITSASDYAEKKMTLEVEGMLHTGMVGRELATKKDAKLEDLSSFYVMDFLKYSKDTQGMGKEQKDAARLSLTRERMDVKHNGTSHREVYEKQFSEIR